MPDQHPMHRRGVEPEDAGDPGRPETPVPAQRHDRGLRDRVGAGRARARPRRAVQQTGAALGPIPGQPLVGGGPRNPHLRRDVGGRATREHPLDQLQT